MRMIVSPDGKVHAGVGIDRTLCEQKAPWLSDLKPEQDGWKHTRAETFAVADSDRCSGCYAAIEQGMLSVPPVAVGDEIYVPASLYCSHGADDFAGGKAVVSAVGVEISAGKPVPFVSVVERPGAQWNWQALATKQEELALRFGDQRAHADPDYRPEFNRWDD